MTRQEAIDKVYGMIGTAEQHEALEFLVPEIRELREFYDRQQENERMLREIKRYIKEQGDKPTGLPNGTVAVSDMIDWLEKQKEQKPLHWRRIEDATTQRTDDGCCVTSEKMLVKGWINDEDYRIVDEGTMVNRDILCIPVRELNAEQKEQKYTELTAEEKMKNDKHFLSICQHLETLISESKNDEAIESIDKDYRWLCEFYRKSLSAPVEENYKKPVEWNESDKVNINSITRYLDAYINEHDNSFGADECKYLKYWLKSLPERFNLQSKQEWNEEDMEKYLFILDLLTEVEWKGEWRMTYPECIDWLKSLRPSWKPSEVQMKYLLMLADYFESEGGTSNAKTLREFHEQLNKLM